MELEPRKRRKLAPQRLAEKLKRIRLDNNLTQAEMLRVVNPLETNNNRARVSQYEKGTRVPSLVEISNYAEFGGFTLEALADDELDLPAPTRRKMSTSPNGKSGKQPAGKKGVIKSPAKRQAKSGFSEEKETAGTVGAAGADRGDVRDFQPANEPKAEMPPRSETAATDEIPSATGRAVSLSRENDAWVAASYNATVVSIRLSPETALICKAAYLELLGGLRFDEMGRMTPEKFLELLIVTALNDQ